MKHCNRCATTKSLDEFNKRTDSPDGLQGICKECNRKASRAHYVENTFHRKAQTNRNRVNQKTERMKFLIEFFKDNPCVKCGETNPILLDFDHIDRDAKTAEISQMINRQRPWASVLEEISKCQVLCVSCHRLKTAKELNWIIYQLCNEHPVRDSNPQTPG